MAVPTNIKTLLSGNVVEWARIEFKETWDAEASLKTICAFANDIDNWGGGYLVIGVREQDGRPQFPLQGVPAEKIDGYLKDMLNKCRRIQPEYMPIVEVADYEGKKFIVVWAPGGNARPYSSPKTMAKDSKERIYYIRKMSSTIVPSETEKRDLYNLHHLDSELSERNRQFPISGIQKYGICGPVPEHEHRQHFAGICETEKCGFDVLQSGAGAFLSLCSD